MPFLQIPEEVHLTWVAWTSSSRYLVDELIRITDMRARGSNDDLLWKNVVEAEIMSRMKYITNGGREYKKDKWYNRFLRMFGVGIYKVDRRFDWSK